MTSVGSRKKGCPALGLVLCLAVSAGAHIGDRVYPVAWLSDEMLQKIDLKDGSVDEWYEVVGEPSMTMLDFASLNPEGSPDPSDLDFRIWLAWHDDPARFYVACIASDDIYKNDHDYNAESWGPDRLWYENDCISVVIDGDHGGGADSDSIERAAEIRNISQGYFAIARTPEGPILDEEFTRYETGEFAWTVLPPYGDGGGGVAGENPTISVIELYVTPFDRWAFDDIEGSVVSDLAPNKTIGFGIIVFDADPPEDEWELPWVEASQPDDHFEAVLFLRADGYLDGMLLPGPGAEPGEDSAVESVSWGRIKASLEPEKEEGR